MARFLHYLTSRQKINELGDFPARFYYLFVTKRCEIYPDAALVVEAARKKKRETAELPSVTDQTHKTYTIRSRSVGKRSCEENDED